MRVIVVSITHRLIPLAHRLSLEGHTVELYCPREYYRAAWRGIFQGSRSQDWREAVHAGEALLLTDDIRTSDEFQHAPLCLGRLPSEGRERCPLGLSGFWQEGRLEGAHWSIVEQGALSGGSGRQVPSSALLVAPAPELSLLAVAEERIRAEVPANWRGVARVEVTNVQEGELGVLRLGWPELSHSLWWCGQDSVTAFVEGKPSAPRGVEFGTVASVPPWPHPPTRASRPLPLPMIPPEARVHLLWHDVELHRRKLRTAGLDGLVAVAMARARYPRTARVRALQAASLLGQEELQIRSDAGELAEQVLVGLEELSLI